MFDVIIITKWNIIKWLFVVWIRGSSAEIKYVFYHMYVVWDCADENAKFCIVESARVQLRDVFINMSRK